jgi:nucleotide-binding universal stress UspA family protein
VYPRIVLAYDGSERSLAARAVAEAAASAWCCGLDLVHVSAGDGPPTFPDLDVEIVHAGSAAAGLIAQVHATEPPGLLCFSSRGRGAVGELVFGSVAAEVIRDVHEPTLVVGPQVRMPTPGPWRRMLVCLDGSTKAAAILPTVWRWASELGLQVHLLHITYPLGDPRIGDLHVPEETRVVTAELRRTAADLEARGIDASWAVVEDTEVAAGIARQAAHRMCELIALCTHGRTGLARVLAGSVAMEIVRRAPVPTLIRRPEHLG